MTDAAIAERDIGLVHDRAQRAKTLRRFRLGDVAFKSITQISAIMVLALLAGVMLSLLHGSLPAWRTFGLEFLITEKWNPVTEKFGALARGVFRDATAKPSSAPNTFPVSGLTRCTRII